MQGLKKINVQCRKLNFSYLKRYSWADLQGSHFNKQEMQQGAQTLSVIPTDMRFI